ncbi:MAG: C4-dicarboxylate ABC transporter [Burkholderiales bacterium PBB1]|nr:MAG: C4-dicarboxylate ABC transporter [Burkholderiales bacterium PBB1]
MRAKFAEGAAVAAPRAGSLDYLPIGLFGSVMGLTGLSVAWHLAHARFGVPDVVAQVISAVAVVAFVLLTCAYAAKIVMSPEAAKNELAHPIAGNLFGTFLISLLLLPIVLAPLSLIVARAMWAIGAIGMTTFAWFIVDRWMSQRQKAAHATPVWIIPVVGMLDVPLAMPALGLESLHAVMVFGLAVGLFFTAPLFTLVFSRLLFEEPLPDALQPSLMILLAPFAVGTSTYVVTMGQVDVFAEALFALTLFMLAVTMGRLRYLAACCPFRVSWWAVSFPLAATAVAALRIASARPGGLMATIAIALLALATVVIAGLLIRTVAGLCRGELRTLSA